MSDINTERTILAQVLVATNQAAESAAQAQEVLNQLSGLAPLASPAFTGVPTAPTAAAGTGGTQLATCGFVAQLLGVANGIATLGPDGKLPQAQLPALHVTSVYVVASESAMLALSAAVGDIAIRTDIGNAEYILTASPPTTLGNWMQIGTSPVLSVAGLTGAILATDLMTALAAAPLASPALTGTPTAPTAAAGTSTTQVATCAFVATSFAPLAAPNFTGVPTAPTATIDTNTGQLATCAFVLGQGALVGDLPLVNGTAAAGTSTHFARSDHIHPTDTTRAPLASPTFTGSPVAPTQAAGDNSTKIATTAYADRAATNAASGKANIASPTFTGTPTAPTITASGTYLATTAMVYSVLPTAPPIPSSSTMPVNWSGPMYAATAVSAGSTIAGGNVQSPKWPLGSGQVGAAAQAGTWRNDSGATLSSGDIGIMTRIA